MTAVTIGLCINQQFNLRFFLGFTQLNTEYYYLLVLCMLPFTFLIFPGSGRARGDRVPWYDVVLFVATAAASIYLMLNVRKAAELGWEFGGAPTLVNGAGLVMWVRAHGGAAPHGRLEPAAERPALHRLSAVRRVALARTAEGQSVDPRPGDRLSRALRREPARHPHSSVRRDRHRLPRVRHGADDDGGRQVLHQPVVRAVRDVPRRCRQGVHFCQRPVGHRRRQHRVERADRRHHDHSGDEEDGLSRVLCRRHRSVRLDRRRAGAAGAGRNRVRHGAVHERELRRSRVGRHHTIGALLHRPVHAGRQLRGPPQSARHPARGASAPRRCHQGGMVLPPGSRACSW